MQHEDIRGADIFAHVAGSDGGDHHLGNADFQRPHRRRDDRRAARTGGADDAKHGAAPLHPALEGERHAGDGGAAIRREDAAGTARMEGGDRVRRDIGAGMFSRGREVDEAHRQSGGLDDVSDLTQFFALGIERAGHQNSDVAAGVEMAQFGRADIRRA